VRSTGTGDEQERGREAEVPAQIPRVGWRDVLIRLKDAVREDRITLIAPGSPSMPMLALSPAMIVVVSIYGLVMDPEEIAAQVHALAVLPGDVRCILTGAGCGQGRGASRRGDGVAAGGVGRGELGGQPVGGRTGGRA
jgi:membrane protein